eukprot:CAMPEP_0203834614 /NCGR_PEP_ID=MMETSP0115-20131106/73249_1 /ASSEMBLY_ACC=CAM_ASM_000227 /TAXON_ID=33651 /ORGANISM="Bicosoecid sp, Strain ms1" /LENGTH=270 /DNA_ID=CAMNT_0050743693 /DNA_START=177 /DNA_END=985 /DNA_ORIENTATION=+
MEALRDAVGGALPDGVRDVLAQVDAATGVAGAGALVVVLVTAVLAWVVASARSHARHRLGARARHDRVGGRRRRRDAVVIVGETGAGKTTLLHQIVSGTCPETVTSMAASEWRVRPALLGGDGKGVDAAATGTGTGGGSDDDDTPLVRLVDVPGHKRLRGTMARYLPSARGIIVVVDSGSMEETLAEAGALLFALLTDEAVAGDGDGDGDGDRSDVRMLVACNDKGVLKRAPQDVKKLLAARLDQLRRAADGALGSTSEGGDGGSGGGGG